jgi:hypothetical protein
VEHIVPETGRCVKTLPSNLLLEYSLSDLEDTKPHLLDLTGLVPILEGNHTVQRFSSD